MTELPPGTEALRIEARQDGFRFVDKLVDEWAAASNRFDGPGEVFIAAFVDGRLAGIGGLNADPYCADPHMGRIRHVYVMRELRRRGVAKAMLSHLVTTGREYFHSLRLRTDTVEGAAFYQAMGFARCAAESASHILDFSAIDCRTGGR